MSDRRYIVATPAFSIVFPFLFSRRKFEPIPEVLFLKKVVSYSVIDSLSLFSCFEITNVCFLAVYINNATFSLNLSFLRRSYKLS